MNSRSKSVFFRFSNLGKGAINRLLVAVLIVQFAIPPQLLLAGPDDEKPGQPSAGGAEGNGPRPTSPLPSPASLADLSLSVNGRLVPGVDDPRSIAISQSIAAGSVQAVNLDFLVGQGLRAPTLDRDILFSDDITFNYPVPPSSNFSDVKIVAKDNELVFQVGTLPKNDPAFVPVVEHFIPGVKVAGETGKQFAATSMNLYFVNADAEGKLDALRAVSIPQTEGSSDHEGSLFKGTIPVTHTVSLRHLPADWKFRGISLLARNQFKRDLLRFDNLAPVPTEIEKGGEDIALTFEDGEKQTRVLWIPQEIANQMQLRRLEQLTWLALLDNGGIDDGEKSELVAFLEAMGAESESIEEARKDIAAIREASGETLTHSDLVMKALKRLKLPWLIHYLAPVAGEATTHDGKTVALIRSRLASLYAKQRDRFGPTWERDFERIVQVRLARKEEPVADETATKKWAGDLQQALKADDRVLSQFEATAESRKALRRKSFARRLLSSGRLKFLAIALGMTGTVAALPSDSAPVEFLTAVGSHIVQATEGNSGGMVIKPILKFGEMVGDSYYTGDWRGFALLAGGFAVCVSQYFLGHLIAGGVATMRGKTGAFFTRSTNLMWDLYCRMIRPWTMPERLKRWIFNGGRTDRLMEARSASNMAQLEANLKARQEAETLAAQLGTLLVEKRDTLAAKVSELMAGVDRASATGTNDAVTDQLVSTVLTDVLAASAVGEVNDIAPDVLVALATATDGSDTGAYTRIEVQKRTEELMSDPKQAERLVAIRALLVRALTAIADTDPSLLPVDGDAMKGKIEFYQKVATQLKAAELTPESRSALGRSFNGFCQFTSKHALSFKKFLGEVLVGVRGATIARQAGRPVPEHIRNEVIRRAIIDFLFSEFNGAVLEPETFTLPSTVQKIPGFMPSLVGSWEQTFSWLMIPIGNMMLTMARPHELEQSAVPFESLGTDLVEPRVQTLESYVAKMFANNFNWDPKSPGFFKNVFNYIKAGVLQHKARCGFLAICLLAGFLITKMTGTPEQAAKIGWSIPLVAWISAYNISFAKASVSPSHVGYAMAWPAVDLGDINTQWAEKNEARIKAALGELGSTDPQLRRRGFRDMKALYHEGYNDLPDRFNKDSAEITEEEAAAFYAYVLTKLPLPTRASALGGTLLNIAGVTFTTLIYFAVFKGLFHDVPTVYESLRDFAYISLWTTITAGGALSLDWASRRLATWFKPMTKAVSSGVDGVRRACMELLGRKPINLK